MPCFVAVSPHDVQIPWLQARLKIGARVGSVLKQIGHDAVFDDG